LGPGTPATDPELSVLSESNSNFTLTGDVSGPGTPIVPRNTHSSYSQSPQLSSNVEMSLITISNNNSSNNTNSGLRRIEEGEWVNREEIVPCLTIDTKDYHPKIITFIETTEDQNDKNVV